MNLFTNLPHKQGFTWWSHFCFASGIAVRLLPSAANFAVHAVIPAVPMRTSWNLEGVCQFLNERNGFVENRHPHLTEQNAHQTNPEQS